MTKRILTEEQKKENNRRSKEYYWRNRLKVLYRKVLRYNGAPRKKNKVDWNDPDAKREYYKIYYRENKEKYNKKCL